MNEAPHAHPSLPTFAKLPLGGTDRRAIVDTLAKQGPVVAGEDLAREVRGLAPSRGAAKVAGEGACVLLLGGSNGILRSVAVRLAFGEGVPVYAVHYDSEKLQIGPHHARAITSLANERGVPVTFRNADATKPEVVADVVRTLAERFRRVHLVNGIAAGATKRYEQHGPTKVADLDVAFDPVRQTADFSSWERVRRVGAVDVDVATPQDIERTNKMMGTSTELWAAPLAEAGLLVRGESLVAFADYDFAQDDPVYGMGPLAGAKVLQRAGMERVAKEYGVRTARLCYPAMNTTAIGAIPGALLMFAGTAHRLIGRGAYEGLPALADRTVREVFSPEFAGGDVRLDGAFIEERDAFVKHVPEVTAENLREYIGNAVGAAL